MQPNLDFNGDVCGGRIFRNTLDSQSYVIIRAFGFNLAKLYMLTQILMDLGKALVKYT